MTQLLSPSLIRNLGTVLASDYAPGDIDTPEKLARLQAGIDSAVGKVFLFDKPYGGSRNYNFLNRGIVTSGSGFLTGYSGSRIEGEAGVSLDCSMCETSGDVRHMIRVVGTPEASHELTADAAQGQAFADIGASAVAAANLRVFDWVRIASDKVFIPGGTVGAEEQGELLQVQQASGGRVTFWTPLRDSYATGDNAVLHKVNMAEQVQLRGLTIHGPGQFDTDTVGDRGFHIVWADRLKVEDCHVRQMDNGNYFYSCTAAEILRNKVEFDLRNGRNANQYGMAFINACQNVLAERNVIVGGKHAIVQSESSLAGGVTRDLFLVRNECWWQWNFALAVHTNAEDVYVDHNLIRAANGGIEAGCRNFNSSFNIIREIPNADLGIGFAITDIGEGVRSTGDTVYGGRFAMRCSTVSNPLFSGSTGPKEIEVRDFTAEGFSQGGLQFLSDLSTERLGFRLSGIRTVNGGQVPVQADGSVDAATSPNSVRFEGKLGDISLSESILRGRSGNTAACIFADTNVDGMDISDVRYKNHAAPILQGSNITDTNVAVIS